MMAERKMEAMNIISKHANCEFFIFLSSIFLSSKMGWPDAGGFTLLDNARSLGDTSA
jgi:hypothetical protein